MDRFALFVDAGYLYGEGGKLVAGTPSRSRLFLDFEIVQDRLATRCAEHCGLPHLRTYWYDAAPGGKPTSAHFRLAHEPRLKVRLGQLTSNGQSGVDGRIIRDLIVLSHNRSMAHAFLLAGDEDLREGVEVAQEWGIPVTLLAVEAAQEGEENLSSQLLRGVDEVLTLGEDDVSEFMWPREEEDEDYVEPEEAHAVGRRFAESWVREADDRRVDAVRDQVPQIPGALDAQLMEEADAALGVSLRNHRQLRHAVRDGFWAVVNPGSDGGGGD